MAGIHTVHCCYIYFIYVPQIIKNIQATPNSSKNLYFQATVASIEWQTFTPNCFKIQQIFKNKLAVNMLIIFSRNLLMLMAH